MIPAEVEAERRMSALVAQFEGLVFETSRQLVFEEKIEMDLDDVRQFLRVKVWKAVGEYSPARSGLSIRRFVFGCLFNAKIDLLKRPRRYVASIDELRDDSAHRGQSAVASTTVRADQFDAQYLSVSAEVVYAEVEREELRLPNLSPLERQVVTLSCDGLPMTRIAVELGLELDQVRSAMRSVREKLSHLRPSASAPRSAPLRPLPDAEPRTARAPAVLAA